jgi:hypothetical protein
MLFGDLLRLPELRLSVISGGTDALELPVTSVYITDLTDPSRFLTPGTVVLSSGLWIDRPGGIDSFLDALVATDATALVLGLIQIGHVPDTVIDACRQRGLVLATINDTVSFARVDDAVRAGVRSPPDPVVGRTLAEEVNAAFAEGSVDDALALVADRVGHACWVSAETGTVTASSAPPDPVRVGAVWDAVRTIAADRNPVEAPVGPAVAVWRVGRSPRRIDALLVVECGVAELDAAAARALSSLASALRPEVRFAAELRSQKHHRATSLVTTAVEGSAPPGEISALMRLVGLDPQGPLSVIAADVDDPLFPRSAAISIVERLVGDPARITSCIFDDRVIAIVEGDDGAPLHERADARRAELEAFLGARRMRVAASDAVTSVSEFGPAVASALERLDDAPGGERISVARSAATDGYRTLLRAVSPQTRLAFAHSVLEPLLEYDAHHGADLVDTIRVFLACGGSWQDAARRLHIHPNTLRYRITRIEDLTHRNLSDMGDRVDLFLALESIG